MCYQSAFSSCQETAYQYHNSNNNTQGDVNIQDDETNVMGCITNLFDDGLGIWFQRTGNDNEADKRQFFLNVLTTVLAHLNIS